MADDEIIEEGGEELAEEAYEEAPRKSSRFAMAQAAGPRPKLDPFTVFLIVACGAFLLSIFLAAAELHDYYDVQFWVFSK